MAQNYELLVFFNASETFKLRGFKFTMTFAIPTMYFPIYGTSAKPFDCACYFGLFTYLLTNQLHILSVKYRL